MERGGQATAAGSGVCGGGAVDMGRGRVVVSNVPGVEEILSLPSPGRRGSEAAWPLRRAEIAGDGGGGGTAGVGEEARGGGGGCGGRELREGPIYRPGQGREEGARWPAGELEDEP